MTTCLLYSLLFGLGTALLGGWIAWLMRRRRIDELLGIITKKDKAYSDLDGRYNQNLQSYNLLQTDYSDLQNKEKELTARVDDWQTRYTTLDTNL